jgi:hypothetical protein
LRERVRDERRLVGAHATFGDEIAALRRVRQQPDGTPKASKFGNFIDAIPD